MPVLMFHKTPCLNKAAPGQFHSVLVSPVRKELASILTFRSELALLISLISVLTLLI